MHLNELIQPHAPKASFTFGRFNPPTKGHAHLLDMVKRSAGNGDHFVFTGRTNDPKRNPLQYQDKITLMRAMFPTINIVDDPKIMNPWQALEELGKHYNDVTLVVGSDRKQDFQSQMQPYMKDFGIEKFQVISSGERDADATDVQGVSATKARAFARAGDFKSFAQTIDGGEKLKHTIYNKVRQGMGITETTKPKMPEPSKKNPNPVAKQLADPKFRPKTIKDKKKEVDKGYVKHKGDEFEETKAYDHEYDWRDEAMTPDEARKIIDTLTGNDGRIRLARYFSNDTVGLVKFVYGSSLGWSFEFPGIYSPDGKKVSLYDLYLKAREKLAHARKLSKLTETTIVFDKIKKFSSLYGSYLNAKEKLAYARKLTKLKEAPEGKPIVYVDLDGVLANFFEEWAKLAGVKSGNYKDIPSAKTDPTLDKMVGTDFFSRLPKFPTTDKLLQMITEMFGGYTILSAPLRGDHKNSEAHKRKWIQRELAIQPENVIVVGRKDSYATQQDGTPNVLIDDRGKNVQAWSNRGGLGIKYQADEDPISKVQDALTQIKNKDNLKEWGGLIVKGVNTTADVGMDAIKKQSAKLGFKVTKKGVPPIMNTKGQPKSKKLESINRMKNILISINGSNKNLTLQQQIDLLEVTKGIKKVLEAKRVKKIRKSNQAEVPYQNDQGTMSLFTHPGTELWQRMKATAKPGTEDWFKTWRTLSYLTKGRKNHYMLPIKEQLEKLLIKHGILKEDPQAVQDLAQRVAGLPGDVSPRILDKIQKALRLAQGGDASQYKKVARAIVKVKDQDLQKYYEAVAKAMIGNGLTTQEMSAIIREIKNNTCVDIKQLKQPFNTLDKIIKFYNASTETQQYYKDLLMYQPAQRIGPGEILLATHSKTLIKGKKGDLTVLGMGGEPAGEIEVKGGKEAGRFTDDDLQPAPNYLPLVKKFKETYIGKINYTPKTGSGYEDIINAFNNNPEIKDQMIKDVEEIVNALFQNNSYTKNIIDAIRNGNPGVARHNHAMANISAYFKVKQGGMGILFIKASANPPQTAYSDTLEELTQVVTFKVEKPYPISHNKTAPFPKISVIPKI